MSDDDSDSSWLVQPSGSGASHPSALPSDAPLDSDDPLRVPVIGISHRVSPSEDFPENVPLSPIRAGDPSGETEDFLDALIPPSRRPRQLTFSAAASAEDIPAAILGESDSSSDSDSGPDLGDPLGLDGSTDASSVRASFASNFRGPGRTEDGAEDSDISDPHVFIAPQQHTPIPHQHPARRERSHSQHRRPRNFPHFVAPSVDGEPHRSRDHALGSTPSTMKGDGRQQRQNSLLDALVTPDHRRSHEDPAAAPDRQHSRIRLRAPTLETTPSTSHPTVSGTENRHSDETPSPLIGFPNQPMSPLFESPDPHQHSQFIHPRHFEHNRSESQFYTPQPAPSAAAVGGEVGDPGHPGGQSFSIAHYTLLALMISLSCFPFLFFFPGIPRGLDRPHSVARLSSSRSQRSRKAIPLTLLSPVTPSTPQGLTDTEIDSILMQEIQSDYGEDDENQSFPDQVSDSHRRMPLIFSPHAVSSIGSASVASDEVSETEDGDAGDEVELNFSSYETAEQRRELFDVEFMYAGKVRHRRQKERHPMTTVVSLLFFLTYVRLCLFLPL